jgi:hypothetical protein
MADKTPAEALQEQFEASQQAAIDDRENQKPPVETEEEYYERVRTVPGIFGDTDTTAGVTASETEVPSSQNEVAGQAVAAVEAEREEADPDDPVQDVSEDEVRSNVSAGRVDPDADEGEVLLEGDEDEDDTEESEDDS